MEPSQLTPANFPLASASLLENLESRIIAPTLDYIRRTLKTRRYDTRDRLYLSLLRVSCATQSSPTFIPGLVSDPFGSVQNLRAELNISALNPSLANDFVEDVDLYVSSFSKALPPRLTPHPAVLRARRKRLLTSAWWTNVYGGPRNGGPRSHCPTN